MKKLTATTYLVRLLAERGKQLPLWSIRRKGKARRQSGPDPTTHQGPLS